MVPKMHIGFLSLILAKAALIAGKFCIRTHPHLSRNGASLLSPIWCKMLEGVTATGQLRLEALHILDTVE